MAQTWRKYLYDLIIQSISLPMRGSGGKQGVACAVLRDPAAAARGMGRLAAYDVLQTGAGTAHSRVVTRCTSALTGQALGRWRSILSLYCLIWVAILQRVRMTVEG